EPPAMEGKGGGGAHDGRHRGGGEADQQAVAEGREDLLVVEELAVPVEGEALPAGGQPSLVERERGQHQERRVEEQVDEEAPEGEAAGRAARGVACHLRFPAMRAAGGGRGRA